MSGTNKRNKIAIVRSSQDK